MALSEAESARLRRAAEIFGRAQEIGDPGARAECVRSGAAGDAQLAELVGDLLSAFDQQQRISAGIRAGRAKPREVPGGRFGPYLLIRLIGRGGTGSVYLAERDQPGGPPAAVKVLDPVLHSPGHLDRFQREARFLAGLDHPGIARILDAGVSSTGRAYLAMEYVDGGQPITEWAAGRGINEKLVLFTRVCEAVDHAHRNLIVHRDLKPANILVDRHGCPKLLDFGLAKLLDPDRPGALTRTLLLTPRYASPEQLRGETVGTPSDVHALGTVLYEVMSGRHPYPEAQSPLVALERALRGTMPDPPPGVPRDLAVVILKAMAHDPERRYRGAWQLAADVERFLGGHPVSAHPPSVLYETRKFLRRHLWGVAAAGLLCASLASGIVTAVHERNRAERHLARARQLVSRMVFHYSGAVASLEGSEPLRERIASDALAYLATLSREAASDPDMIRELAFAYAKIAEIEGPGPTALGHYRTALGWFERLDTGVPEIAEARNRVMAAIASIETPLPRR